MTILDLKKMIQKKEKISCNRQRLQNHKGELKDDDTMDKLKPYDTIYLILRLLGGGGGSGYSKEIYNYLLDFHSVDGYFSQFNGILAICWKENFEKKDMMIEFFIQLLINLDYRMHNMFYFMKESKEEFLILNDEVLATLFAVGLIRKGIKNRMKSWQLIDEKALEWLAKYNSNINWENALSDITDII